MNENEKAQRYTILMSEYTRLENMILQVPQLSLDEQMKHVDATNKVLYTKENQQLVNKYRARMAEIRHDAMKNQLITLHTNLLDI